MLKAIGDKGPQEFLMCKDDGFTLLHHCVLQEDEKTFDMVMEQFGTEAEVLEYNNNEVSVGA